VWLIVLFDFESIIVLRVSVIALQTRKCCLTMRPNRRLQMHVKRKIAFYNYCLVKHPENVESYFPSHSDFLVPSVRNRRNCALEIDLSQ
jgi:hypothetical protein